MPFTLPAPAEIEGAVAAWRTLYQPLDRLLVQLPPDKALRRFGIALWKAGEVAAAVQVLTAAAALAPEDAATWRDLANALSVAGRSDDAQFAIEASIAKDAAQPQGWLLLATLLNGAHKYPDAERAFRRALEQDPNLAEAAFGLGILFFQQQRYDEAIERLATASAAGCHNVGLYVCLGQAQFLTGRFLAAADSFARAARFEPADKMVRDKVALLTFIKTIIEDSVEAAVAAYRDLMGEDGEEADALAYKVFHLLSGYGYREAAQRLGRAWLSGAPEDPVRRFLVDAASGTKAVRAPEDYVITYFNRFADGFDNQLRRVLRYRVPEELHALLAERGQNFSRILDLGCGTGLAAQFLKSFDCKLTGVDLAPLMLAKAKERQVYDELIEAEAVAYLAQHDNAFDLVFAADSLIYFGELRMLFAAVAKVLVPGGVFAFSIEKSDADDDYVLQLSGRFAHSLAYIAELARKDFVIENQIDTTIRLEANRPVPGALVILHRRKSRSRQEQQHFQSLAPVVSLTRR
jgi:predicted TPR repeat methyltransferase